MISTRSLAHQPPKAARREFDRGIQAWRKGQSEAAVRHVEDAVGLDPNFVDAQNELGFLYCRTGRQEQALGHFDRALELEPNLAALHINKAGALVALSRWAEAEQTARRAVKLDPASIEANYLLGAALIMQGKITVEAAAHLRVAADALPLARKLLAEVQANLAEDRSH